MKAARRTTVLDKDEVGEDFPDMKKGVSITQINTVVCPDEGTYATVYGLGDDGRVYRWETLNSAVIAGWKLYITGYST